MPHVHLNELDKTNLDALANAEHRGLSDEVGFLVKQRMTQLGIMPNTPQISVELDTKTNKTESQQ